MYAVLDLIKKLYKPRTCHLPLSPEAIGRGQFKPCLEYHIHNCMGPCVGRQSYDEYQENMRQAREILKGNTRQLRDLLYQNMQRLAENLEFEAAERVKQKYILIENYCAKSEVVSHTITDVDVFTITDDDSRNHAFINFLHVKMAPSARASPTNISASSMKPIKNFCSPPYPKYASAFIAQHAK